MAARKPGMGEAGRERLRRNWSDIDSGNLENSTWSAGKQSEEDATLREEIANQNFLVEQRIRTQYVQPLEDKPENYGQGPGKSTRVIMHRFVPNREEGLGQMVPSTHGVVFVGFQKRNDVYAYYDVPYSVYQSFAMSNSKGRFINSTLNNYDYVNLKNTSKTYMTGQPTTKRVTDAALLDADNVFNATFPS